MLILRIRVGLAFRIQDRGSGRAWQVPAGSGMQPRIRRVSDRPAVNAVGGGGIGLHAGILTFPALAGRHVHRHDASTVLPPATVSSAVRSFLMTSSVVCRFRFMGVMGAHAPGLS